MVQRRGTARVGGLFGPIMIVWFLVIGLLGVIEIAQHPDILLALNPITACACWARPGRGFVLLGAVVLAVTGAEALYADMGHFGRRPIRLAWLCFVFPALLLNYFGQGALLLPKPERDRQSVLPAGAGLGVAADGRARLGRDGDRLAGGDLGRVLDDAPGGAARLSAALRDPPYLGA